ncbi:gliding motility protein [Streptomyces sp. NPDC048638]|uniref:gliding motility protein n=1 Tax=Streptomyces sp. NPDC048638 TaxID=3365580 RepID=UPI003723C7BE
MQSAESVEGTEAAAAHVVTPAPQDGTGASDGPAAEAPQAAEPDGAEGPGIPRQQSAQEAADSDAGDGAHA